LILFFEATLKTGSSPLVWPGALTIMDGLHINENIQVTDAQGDAIEGLQAGDVAGGFFAGNFYPGLAAGVAVGKTMTFARHAMLHMTGAL